MRYKQPNFSSPMTLVEDPKTPSNPSKAVFQGVPPSSKANQLDKAGFKTFEEVYRTSYSHGLEAIYNIETVDLKTVRRIGEKAVEKLPSKKLWDDFIAVECEPEQLEFDYGAGYREWMESFVLQEPIQVLSLSKHAEKNLIEQGICTIQNLMQEDFSKWVFMKGIGQGHIDEVQQKLASYTQNKPLKRCSYIDFRSWLKGILGTYSCKKVFVALEPYKLEDLFTLSPSESVEVRRLPLEKRLEWRHEMDSEFSIKKEEVFKDMGKVVEAFIKPWLLRRLGFATKEELVERLLRASNTPGMVSYSLDFFSSVFFYGRFPLEDYLSHIPEGVFFASVSHSRRYEQVVDKAMSYFYKDGAHYSLNELTTLLMREFAMSWEHFSPEFIKKVLRFSSKFRVRKAERGILRVKLA